MTEFVVFSEKELKEKGIGKKNILKMIRSTEKRIAHFVKQYRDLGYVSAKFEKMWDLECQKWDHLKKTLAQFN